jgi:hypothetical protein
MREPSITKAPAFNQAGASRFRILQVLQLFEAAAADVLAIEDLDVGGVVAEDAGGLILTQDDVAVLHVNLDGIAFGQIEGISQFLGDDDPPKLVQLSNDSCCFHGSLAPLLYIETARNGGYIVIVTGLPISVNRTNMSNTKKI